MQGECERNPTYMSIWCESSCTVCAPHVHEAFEDIDLDNSTKITGDELHKWLYMVLQSQMEHAQEARKDGEESEEDWQKNYDAEVKAAALSMRESEDAGIEPSQFRTEFEMVDIDKDGFVSYEEAMAEIDGRFEETINLPQEEKMPDEEKETFMANLMKDMNLMKKYEGAKYKAADLDGDGKQNIPEFIYNRMKPMPEYDELLHDAEHDAKRELAEIDSNGDGEVDYDEWEKHHERLHVLTHPMHLRELIVAKKDALAPPKDEL